MDEARAVLERLERIEALDAAAAAPDELLAELRALVREAESWARRERDPEAQAAAARCAEAIDAHAIVRL
jgi:primosomal protein N''